MKKILVVAAADIIVALANPDDSNHVKAAEMAQRLAKLGASVVYPATAVAEAVTVIQRILKNPTVAYATAVSFADQASDVLIDITGNIYVSAVRNWFSAKGSLKHTLFDCIVASVAKEYGADAIFSFDHFYKSKGFILIEDFLADK